MLKNCLKNNKKKARFCLLFLFEKVCVFWIKICLFIFGKTVCFKQSNSLYFIHV